MSWFKDCFASKQTTPKNVPSPDPQNPGIYYDFGCGTPSQSRNKRHLLLSPSASIHLDPSDFPNEEISQSSVTTKENAATAAKNYFCCSTRPPTVPPIAPALQPTQREWSPFDFDLRH
jgi:hypothetical protein